MILLFICILNFGCFSTQITRFTFHLHDGKAVCDSQKSSVQRYKYTFLNDCMYVHIIFQFFGCNFCMLYFSSKYDTCTCNVV